MKIWNRFLDAIGNRRHSIAWQEKSGWTRLNPLCSAYENVFAQVRAMVDDLITVQPYGVGRNGAKLSLARTPELTALQDPNEDMSWVEFADTMFTIWLTEKELNVHVWKNKNGSVYGYSVLPVGCRQNRTDSEGRELFQFVTANNGIVTLTSDEVMTLRFSRSPLNLDQGVSPASAIFTWSQIDDLMAQLQKARLENGAVPATITFLRAKTRDDFEKRKDDLERGLRGAKNKGKTVYIYRQSLDTGETADEMEVKPIQEPNSTLAIRDLMNAVNDRINKAFGVSNFIMGDDASAKYDNAELTRQQFLEHRILPALTRFWAQFQHELDRVVGGLGYGIQFDLAIPELTDRMKTKAETARINTESLVNMIKSGANPYSATKALGLGENWQQAAQGIYARALSEQNSTSINSSQEAKQKIILLRKDSATQEIEKATDASEPFVPTFELDEADQKKIYDELMKVAQAIADKLDAPLDKVKEAIVEILDEQAMGGANEGAERVKDLLLNENSEAAEQIASALADGGYEMPSDFTERLQERVSTLVDNFSGYTAEIIKETLETAQKEGLSASQIKTKLSQALPRSRAEMIARNEVGHAFEAGRIENDKRLATQFGVTIQKVWRCHHDSHACPICEAMDGEVVELEEAFPDHVEREVDGKIETFAFDRNSWNNDGEVPHAHVNCRCYFDEVVV